MVFPHPRRHEFISFLHMLREKIIVALEQLEPLDVFHRERWNYSPQGGGEIAVLKGKIFEKAAVNWSGVGGPSFPMADGKGAFFAAGVSLITHMANPHAPTAHFNLRLIETEETWGFGGGYDLTPMGFPYDEDTQHFHGEAQKALRPFGSIVYETFSQHARDYFYLPHRKKERGVGGIFFDSLNSGDVERDFQLWQAVGTSFLAALLPIYHKRIHHSYTSQEREEQLRMRAHYVEFNLLYDRGTRFGFQSGGNPEAILCSMPPLVKWS